MNAVVVHITTGLAHFEKFRADKSTDIRTSRNRSPMEGQMTDTIIEKFKSITVQYMESWNQARRQMTDPIILVSQKTFLASYLAEWNHMRPYARLPPPHVHHWTEMKKLLLLAC